MMLIRRIAEAVLALPATVVYGIPAVIGVPAVALFALPGVVVEPSLLIVYTLVLLLLLSALLGLTAVWISIFGGLRHRPGLVAGALIVGLVGSGGFVLMTFSNDRFGFGQTWSFNSSILWPLLLVIPVGLSRLVATLRTGR